MARTAVATNPTIALGNPRTSAPSGPLDLGNFKSKQRANDDDPPAKYKLRITVMIWSFW